MSPFKISAVTNANQYDVNVSNANNVIMNGLNISGGQVGITFSNLTDSVVQDNSIQNALVGGIGSGEANSNINISNNTINNAANVGTIPKQGLYVVECAYAGIGVKGTPINISNNTITNSGYDGICFSSKDDKGVIQNNTIDKSCLVLDDCGGIYTSGTTAGSTIVGNTIIRSLEIPAVRLTHIPKAGQYIFDEFSNHFSALNNYISNVSGGIFINGGYDNTITGNSVYGAGVAYGMKINEISGELVHDNIITGNTFETTATGLAMANYWSGVEKVLNFGTYDNNLYCHPKSNYVVQNLGTNYSLSSWQAFSGQDQSSTDSASYCPHNASTGAGASSSNTVTSGGTSGSSSSSSGSSSSASQRQSQTSQSLPSTTPLSASLIGNNPAYIKKGSSYLDPGLQVTGSETTYSKSKSRSMAKTLAR